MTFATPAVSTALAELDDLILEAYALVREALAGAAKAFLAGDRDEARRVSEADERLDDLHEHIQALALGALIHASDESEDVVRSLVTIVRVAPELERSGDLATHIADLAGQGLVHWLTPRACDLIAQMGAIGVEMWQRAANAYVERDGTAGARLRMIDDEIDDLHVSLITELAAMPVSVPVAVQVGLAARYFERLGDHAVNVTQQLRHVRRPD